MKHFELYSHPTLGHAAVKRGFSWPGFFFTAIWMLLCRMWLGAILLTAIYWGALFVINLIAVSIEQPGDFGPADLLYIAAFFGLPIVFGVIVGTQGNAWRRSTLAKRGFAHMRSVQAETADAAIAQVGTEQQTTQNL